MFHLPAVLTRITVYLETKPDFILFYFIYLFFFFWGGGGSRQRRRGRSLGPVKCWTFFHANFFMVQRWEYHDCVVISFSLHDQIKHQSFNIIIKLLSEHGYGRYSSWYKTTQVHNT